MFEDSKEKIRQKQAQIKTQPEEYSEHQKEQQKCIIQLTAHTAAKSYPNIFLKVNQSDPKYLVQSAVANETTESAIEPANSDISAETAVTDFHNSLCIQ